MNFRGYLLIFLAIVFQLALSFKLSVFSVAPNLILAAIITIALLGGFKQIWLIFFSGLILDLLAGRIFGIFTLSILFCFILARWLAKNIFKKNNPLSFVILAATSVLMFELVGFFLTKLGIIIFSTNFIFNAKDFLLRQLPTSLILNTILTCLIILMFIKWNFFPKAEN